MFWNKGALTIQQRDLSDADPLRLEIQGKGRILSATLLSVNNIASRPLLTLPMGERVLVTFDYLDPEQGFVIPLTGEVVVVLDGDTIEVLHNKQAQRIAYRASIALRKAEPSARSRSRQRPPWSSGGP